MLFRSDLPTLGRLGSTGAISGLANFLPRTVHRMVMQPDAATAAQDARRIDQVLDMLKPHSLMPALKALMAQLSNDPAWLRTRAPLVSLTPQAQSQLQADWRALAIDPAQA